MPRTYFRLPVDFRWSVLSVASVSLGVWWGRGSRRKNHQKWVTSSVILWQIAGTKIPLWICIYSLPNKFKFMTYFFHLWHLFEILCKSVCLLFNMCDRTHCWHRPNKYFFLSSVYLQYYFFILCLGRNVFHQDINHFKKYLYIGNLLRLCFVL